MKWRGGYRDEVFLPLRYNHKSLLLVIRISILLVTDASSVHGESIQDESVTIFLYVTDKVSVTNKVWQPCSCPTYLF